MEISIRPSKKGNLITASIGRISPPTATNATTKTNTIIAKTAKAASFRLYPYEASNQIKK